MKVFEKLHSSAATTRYSAESIFSDPQNLTTIDFEGIETISRSFADEMLYHLKNTAVVFVNMNDAVSKMIAAVSRQRATGKRRELNNSLGPLVEISADEAETYFAYR